MFAVLYESFTINIKKFFSFTINIKKFSFKLAYRGTQNVKLVVCIIKDYKSIFTFVFCQIRNFQSAISEAPIY